MIEMLTNRSFNERLDHALERMEAGDDATRAAGLNWSSATLVPLLESASALHDVPKGVADQPVRSRVRNRFMSEAAGKRVAWVHRHTMSVAKPRKRPQARRHPIGSAAAFLLLAIVALVIGTVAALAAGFSEPDSPLYPLKTMGESALAAVTRDPVSNADLRITYAAQRLREAEAMAARNQPSLAVDSIRARYDQLRAAAADLERSKDGSARWLVARDRFETEESSPISSVEQGLNNSGNSDAAQQVQALAASYDSERKVIDAQLGTSTTPAAPPPSTKH